MNTRYEADVVAWASEQARLIRAGQFDQLDLAHIAEEIEDMGKGEQRELAAGWLCCLPISSNGSFSRKNALPVQR